MRMNITVWWAFAAGAAKLGLVSAFTLLACRTAPPPVYGAEAGDRAAPGRPSWIDGRSSRYSDALYLTGVGRGPARLPCENDARAALAKVFEARISQESSDWQGHISRVNETRRVVVEAMALDQLTRVSTDHALRGSRVAELWQSPEGADSGEFHCLAVLERQPAARTLRDEIDRFDSQIAAKVREGDAAPNATARFFAYKRALELLQRREALNAELRIVDVAGRGRPPIHGWEALVAKFGASQSKIKVGLQLSGRDADKLQACLLEKLTERGIQVLEQTSDVDVMIHGTLRWKWAGEVMGSYMVRVDLNLRLVNVDSGRTIASFAEGLKTGRPEREMALQSASNKLCFKTSPALAKKLEGALGENVAR